MIFFCVYFFKKHFSRQSQSKEFKLTKKKKKVVSVKTRVTSRRIFLSVYIYHIYTGKIFCTVCKLSFSQIGFNVSSLSVYLLYCEKGTIFFNPNSKISCKSSLFYILYLGKKIKYIDWLENIK